LLGASVVRLIACQNCHTQYDVTDVHAERISCRCGESVANVSAPGVDAEVHRCGSCGATLAGDAEGCTYCGSEVVRDGRNLSLICPECHGRNADNSRFCTACGVLFAPEAVKPEGYEVPCPVCTSLMPPRQIGGIGINECSSCNGIWTPEDRFEQLIGRAIEARRGSDPALRAEFEPRMRGSNPAAQKVAYRKCPECDAFMQRRNFRRSSGVIVDRCNKHGTWLDADELEQITGFLMSGGNPEASALLEEAAVAAAKERTGAEFARMATEVDWTPRSRRFESGGGFAKTLVGVLESLLR
jgi:Zn-finger nucleic acid-binding protein